MKAKILVYALPALVLATIQLAHAQQPAKVPRIGVLLAGSGGGPGELKPFRQGLRDLGYIEGKNITIEYTKGKPEGIPGLAADLIQKKLM
jgi:putative ABC transport system substrate-binding protein